MAGRIKGLIDEMIRVRAGDNPALVAFVRAHLMMKGIQPERYGESSPDDPATIARLEQMLADFRGAAPTTSAPQQPRRPR